jgi:hypothetical protein
VDVDEATSDAEGAEGATSMVEDVEDDRTTTIVEAIRFEVRSVGSKEMIRI